MRNLQLLTLSAIHDTAGGGARIAIHIDGESLIERIRRIELPQATREGAALLAGNYRWPALSTRQLLAMSGDTGEGALPCVLLNCECGLSDCWPLTVWVRAQSRLVIWESIQQQRRADRWRYDALTPMRFSRSNYLGELELLRDALKTAQAVQSVVRSVSVARSW